jgi:molybdopterin-guanine dinucleotide biosynthesis protein A
MVPMVNGFLEPLCAIYHKRATRTLEEAPAEGIRKVTDGIRRLSFSTLPEDLLRTADPDLRSFTNVNSREDLDRLDALLLRQADRPS